MPHRKVKKHWEENAAAWVQASENGYDLWRDKLNTPAFLNMLPDLSGLKGLDVGCGDGHNSRHIAPLCQHLTAIDLSDKFLDAANKQNKLDNLVYQKANAAKLPFFDGTFDFVVATMSFMDIAEIGTVFAELNRVLVPSGFIQFSIIHPCFNEHKGQWATDQDGHQGFLMKDYFLENKGEIHEWKHPRSPNDTRPFKVPRFSKPLSTWVNLLSKAGFYIDALEEPYASDDILQDHPELATTRVVAHSLIIRCKKNIQNKFNEEVLRKLPGNAWWKDKNLVYLGCNNNVLKTLNMPLESFVGKKDHDLWSKEIADELLKADLKVFNTGKTITIEETILSTTRKQVMLTNKSPLLNERSEIMGLLGTSTDITDRKRMEEELRQAKGLVEISKAQAKTEEELRKLVMILVGDIVHDLRTPIATIRSVASILNAILAECVEIIKEAKSGKSKRAVSFNLKQWNYLLNNTAVTSLMRCAGMIDNFINASLTELKIAQKVEKENLKRDDLTICSMRRIIENVIEVYPMDEKVEIEFRVHDFFFMGNSILMMKVLFNLIKNAAEQVLLTRTGTILIFTKESEDTNYLVVKDTAGGAPAQIMDKIFSGYFTTKAQGTGIGLFFCKKIIQDFGGDITAHSVYGESMEISISFPKINQVPLVYHHDDSKKDL